MLGRGRRNAATEFLDVRLTIMCPRNHKVGMAWKLVPPDPNEGYRSTLPFTDTPTGGMVEKRCEKCGAHVQARWERIREQLDQMERDGLPEGTFTPDTPDVR